MNAVTEQHTEGAQRSAPVKATWICLILAWVLFLLPIPGLGLFVGWPLNLVAFILAIVVMTRGRTMPGLFPLISSLIVSPIVYFVGLAIFGAAAIGAPAYQDYKQRAAEAAGGASAQVEEASQVSADAIAVSARDLYLAYNANEVAADSQYKAKPLRVTGTVAGINKDLFDKVYVEIDTGEMFNAIHARDLPTDVAAGLSKGQKVTVQCIGDGLMIGSPILADCKLI